MAPAEEEEEKSALFPFSVTLFGFFSSDPSGHRLSVCRVKGISVGFAPPHSAFSHEEKNIKKAAVTDRCRGIIFLAQFPPVVPIASFGRI